MSKDYSPDIIAQSFVKQYYEMLSNNPSELYKFYNDDSHLSFSDSVRGDLQFHGIDNIRQGVNVLNLAGARVDLSEGSIDAQRSEQQGVFLVVTGKFTIPGSKERHFVQCFFLACQKASTASYFVRNSVFRLIGPDCGTPEHVAVERVLVDDHPAPSAFESTLFHAPEPINADASHSLSGHSDTALNDNIEDGAHGLLSAVDDSHAYAAISDDHEVLLATAPVEPFVESRQAAPAAAAPVAAAPSAGAKVRSFADLVKNWNESEIPIGTTTNKTAAARPKQAKAEKGSKSEPSAKAVEASAAGEEDANKKAGSTLYVSNLPVNATESQLTDLFHSYGAIRKVAINTEKNSATVEFEEEGPAVQTIVATAKSSTDKNGAFSINNQRLRVDDKIHKSGSSKGKSRGEGTAGAKDSNGTKSKDSSPRADKSQAKPQPSNKKQTSNNNNNKK